MSYDVKAKHGELLTLLSEQYKAYSDARAAFNRAEHDREWERYKARKDKGLADSRTVEQDYKDYQEDLAWETANEDKKKMEEAGMKLHLTVRHTVKHYSYWHVGRIRVASGIRSTDWLMFMTPLCLPSYLSMDVDDRKQNADWTQAVDLADSFTAEEFKNMSARQYAHEVFKRANNLLDMKQAQAVG